MKFLVALALFLVAVSAITDERKAEIKAIGQECLTSSGVEKEKITALRAGTFSEDPHLKSFISCVFKKSGGMSDDGTFNKDVVKSDFGANKATLDAALGCLESHGATADETAFLAYKCFRTHAPADYKTPW